MQAWDHIDFPKKKPWDTPYGPGKASTADKRSQYRVQQASQFPPKKFYYIVEDDMPDDYVSVRKTIVPWMAANGVKGRYVGEVQLDDGRYVEGFSFKRTSDTIRFKLTWG